MTSILDERPQTDDERAVIADLERELALADVALDDYIEGRRAGDSVKDADQDLITQLMKRRNDIADALAAAKAKP